VRGNQPVAAFARGSLVGTRSLDRQAFSFSLGHTHLFFYALTVGEFVSIGASGTRRTVVVTRKTKLAQSRRTRGTDGVRTSVTGGLSEFVSSTRTTLGTSAAFSVSAGSAEIAPVGTRYTPGKTRDYDVPKDTNFIVVAHAGQTGKKGFNISIVAMLDVPDHLEVAAGRGVARLDAQENPAVCLLAPANRPLDEFQRRTRDRGARVVRETVDPPPVLRRVHPA